MLFADTGLSDAAISALFAIWSAVGIVAEVPTGALADRFSRRGALVAAGVLQAAGYALWIGWPGFPAFATGFVLWGLGGSLVSGSLEALLYDGLAAVAAEEQFARVLGWVRAASLVAQVPAALAATVLFALGGYAVVGWVSVGCCLAAAALAARLPEPPRAASDETEDYLATLRAGVSEATAHPVVRDAVLAVALLTSMDALEEYFALLTRDWGVPTALNPVVVLGIPLAGAAGAVLAGRAARWRTWTLAAALAAGAVLLGGSGLLRQPIGVAAVALFYGGYRLILVVVDTRLQELIDGPARATVTSVAGLGTDLATFGIYAAWVLGGVVPVAVLLLLVAVALPRLLRHRAGSGHEPVELSRVRA